MFDLVTGFALVGVVLVISALASPLVERAPISFPIIFLGLGFALGPVGLDFLPIDAHDTVVEVVATFTLTLVLFLDAVKIQVDELGKHWLVPLLILGPGTILIVLLIAGATWLVLSLAVVPALLVGAALASTDPVVLRDVVKDAWIPRSIRQILKLEVGLNDLVVLPIVLVLIAVANVAATGAGEWLGLLARLLLIGPVIGFAIGGLGSWIIGKADGRLGIQREFQALFGMRHAACGSGFELSTVRLPPGLRRYHFRNGDASRVRHVRGGPVYGAWRCSDRASGGDSDPCDFRNPADRARWDSCASSNQRQLFLAARTSRFPGLRLLNCRSAWRSHIRRWC